KDADDANRPLEQRASGQPSVGRSLPEMGMAKTRMSPRGTNHHRSLPLVRVVTSLRRLEDSHTPVRCGQEDSRSSNRTSRMEFTPRGGRVVKASSRARDPGFMKFGCV